MLNTILIIIGVLFALFILIFIYSACVISGRCNKTMEQYESDILCENEEENRDLTGLENQTLERLLQLYEEGGVNFVINDGKVVDYEVE
jgi:hypothetical protein